MNKPVLFGHSTFVKSDDLILNSIDPLDLLKRLEYFRKIDKKNIDINELQKYICSTIVAHCNFYREYKKGISLYRLREVESEYYTEKKDLIYPPSNKSTLGRLNRKNQSMLYVSLDSITPFYEIKNLKSGDKLCLIEYEIISDEFVASVIGEEGEFPENYLNHTGLINHKIIEQFLCTEITKEVGNEYKYIYNIINFLADTYYNIPKTIGYEYPSVVNNNKINLAIFPKDADDKIRIKEVKNIIFEGFVDEIPKYEIISTNNSIR
jgi:hypothetical protein